MATLEKPRATGRRRTAVASAKLTSGRGDVTVNGRSFEDYFNTTTQRTLALQPLLVTDNHKKYDVSASTRGGGLTGQAGALSLAISRALVSLNPELKSVLRTHGLLTRDSRMKERKKSGQPGARKRFQFSKR
jgi:small subunit ribosomal protein S9